MHAAIVSSPQTIVGPQRSSQTAEAGRRSPWRGRRTRPPSPASSGTLPRDGRVRTRHAPSSWARPVSTVAQSNSPRPSSPARTRTCPPLCTCRARGSGWGSVCPRRSGSLSSPRHTCTAPRRTARGCCSQPRTLARRTPSPPSLGRRSRRHRDTSRGQSSARGTCQPNSPPLASGDRSCTCH